MAINSRAAARAIPTIGQRTVVSDGQIWLDSGVSSKPTIDRPEARNIGLHGNRQIVLDHRPTPYLESLNSRVDIVPSLYAYQRAMRLREAAD